MSLELDQNILHFSIVPNPLVTDKKVNRAIVQAIHWLENDQAIEEIAFQTGLPVETVAKVFNGITTNVSEHCQNGHGIRLEFMTSKPLIKGNLEEEQTKLNYPEQKVEFKLALGEKVDINYEKIKTQRIETTAHVVVIESAEDGVTETDGQYLTVNGTLIIEGLEVHVNEEKEDEGVFILDSNGGEHRCDKLYVNTRSTIQARIPKLAPGDRYEVEIRKRFNRNKKLFVSNYHKKFEVQSENTESISD